MDGRMRVDGWIDGWTDEWTYVRMDGRMDGWAACDLPPNGGQEAHWDR